jgi:peptidyl-prolyl isomerase E (cyclophilin E)
VVAAMSLNQKALNEKRTLYIGGLAEEVNEKLLHAAFITFGEIVDLVVPIDPATQKNRGFAFIEFEDAEDAAHALDNMNNAEFFNRVLKINYAKPQAVSKNKAIWATDEYYEKYGTNETKAENQQQPQQQQEQQQQMEATTTQENSGGGSGGSENKMD